LGFATAVTPGSGGTGVGVAVGSMKAGATDGAVGVAVGAAGAAGAAGSSDDPHAKTTNKLNPKAIPKALLVVSPRFIFSLLDLL
tara:strand:- start:220 stop:471 length:252 start_codon:yes stop_codon:yes gene_type:complete